MLQQILFSSISSLRLLTAQVFPGELQLQTAFSPNMTDKNSDEFISTAKEITDAVGDHIKDPLHFEKVDLRLF